MQDGTEKPRGRGRPRSFDPAAALKAAGERFRVSGFDGTSLDDLSEATGLNRPSLYAAFGDKRAMYLAVLERAFERATRAFDSIENSNLTLPELLDQILSWTIDGYMRGDRGPAGCIAISTAATAAVEDAAVRDMLARFVALEDERVAGLLARAGSPMPAAHGRIVAAVIHSLSTRTRAGASREELDQLKRDCILLVAGRLPD